MMCIYGRCHRGLLLVIGLSSLLLVDEDYLLRRRSNISIFEVCWPRRRSGPKWVSFRIASTIVSTWEQEDDTGTPLKYRLYCSCYVARKGRHDSRSQRHITQQQCFTFCANSCLRSLVPALLVIRTTALFFDRNDWDPTRLLAMWNKAKPTRY